MGKNVIADDYSTSWNAGTTGRLGQMTIDRSNVTPMVGAARTCLVVLGMHRSGTSAVTSCLSLLGAQLAADIVGSNPWNRRGHWEPARLVQVHDELWAEVGSRWDDWCEVDWKSLRREQV